jgi:hypothetical protein
MAFPPQKKARVLLSKKREILDGGGFLWDRNAARFSKESL